MDVGCCLGLADRDPDRIHIAAPDVEPQLGAHLQGDQCMTHRAGGLLAGAGLALTLVVSGGQSGVAQTSVDRSAAVTALAVVHQVLEVLGLEVAWPSALVAAPPGGDSGGRTSQASGPRKLPSDLRPSLNDPTSVKPRSYADGCHRRAGQTTVKRCVYGDPHGTISVVLFGDSHASMWLPALDSIAARRGWKLYSVTKSACAVARVARDQPGHSKPDCDTWRKNAQAFIAGIHPDLVIAADVERQGSAGHASYAAWNAGMLASLKTLVRHADRVVLLGQTPRFENDVPACLRTHRRDTRRCDSPRSFALSPKRQRDDKATAAAADALFVPMSDITCPNDPCASVIGRYMVSYDDQHMTPAFVKHLIPQFESKLPLP